jgi:hypothetical protein
MTATVILHIATVITSILIGLPEDLALGAAAPRVAIQEIKANPKRYDGMVVETLGILDCGHYGPYLRSTRSEDVLRLKFLTADHSEVVRVVRDSLFTRLRELTAETELPNQPLKQHEVELVGRICVLKRHGRPVKKYYPQIESPVEMIPIQVLRITDSTMTEK